MTRYVISGSVFDYMIRAATYNTVTISQAAPPVSKTLVLTLAKNRYYNMNTTKYLGKLQSAESKNGPIEEKKEW